MISLTIVVPTIYVALLDFQIYLEAKKKDPTVKYDWKKALTRVGLSLLTAYAASLGIPLASTG